MGSIERMHASASQDGNPEGKVKIRRAGWLLFASGFLLGLTGFAINYLFFAESKKTHADMPWLQSLSVAILLLALLCWVLAPFFTKLPIWAKILLSLGSIVLWSFLGNIWVAFIQTEFNPQIG